MSLDDLHHREVHGVLVFDEIENLLRLRLAGAAPRLLRAELVARVSQDLKALVLVILVHLDQLLVVPLSDASFGSNVDDENGLLILDEVAHLARPGFVELLCFDVEER